MTKMTNDMIDAIRYAVSRLDEESSKYIKEKNEGKEGALDVLTGMYFAIDSLNNSLIAYFGDDMIAKAVGAEDLVKKIESGFKRIK